MGEAKKRGTFKERQTLAREKKAFEDMERRKAQIERDRVWAERRAAEDAARIARGEEPLPEPRRRVHHLMLAGAMASLGPEAAAALRMADKLRRTK